MSKGKQITLRLEVTDEFCDDIISIAEEGGINYWAESLNFNGDHRWTESEASSEKAPRKTFELTHDLIRFGLRKVLGDYIMELNSQLRSEIFQAVSENDAGNVDVSGADVIVQAAVFSEIVYG